MSKSKMQVSKNVTNYFHEFCESLKLPYSGAKQYFEQLIIEIDIYNDGIYFYDFYKELDSKNQDTVYNNMQRLYDVTKSEVDRKRKNVSKQAKGIQLYRPKADIEWDKFREDVLKGMDEIKSIFEKTSKLSILSQLLNIADNYRRQNDAINKFEFNKKCEDINRNQKIISSKLSLSFSLSIVCSVIGALSLFSIIIYVIFKIGTDKYIAFIEQYWVEILLLPLLTLAGTWIANSYKKISKIDNIE